MKKQYLVAAIGTLALAANIILPGLAFGQIDQTGTQEISCGTIGLTLNTTGASAFAMDALTVSNAAQDSFGNDIGAGTDNYQNGITTLPNEAFISVSDSRTTGTGCATNGTDEGWEVTAQAADFDNGAQTIAASEFYIVTTANVTPDADMTVNGDFFYDDTYLAGTGPTDITGDVVTATSSDLTDAATFTTDGGSLDTARALMHNGTGAGTDDFKFATIGTGVAYYLNVPANQAGGTYTADVTFTLNDSSIT
jgi:hypothetical protein